MAVAPSKVVGKVFTTSAYNLSRRVKLGRQLSSIFNRPASLHANCFKTPHVKRSARRCRLQTVSSIGFDLPGSPSAKGIEKQAEELIKLASSLLVYQYVLKQKPGQAFLKILLRLQGWIGDGRLAPVASDRPSRPPNPWNFWVEILKCY
uniref:Uncharacterized protein n=1 Tax=Tetraselmis sp. GSL018 TaxID=582737 RepID=A0A061SD89_9CHLO